MEEFLILNLQLNVFIVILNYVIQKKMLIAIVFIRIHILTV